MKTLRKKTIEMFEKYYHGSTALETAIFISNHWKDFKDWSKIKTNEVFENKKEKDIVECEKCGAETTTKLIGDESYDKCPECGWITY